MDYRIGAAQRSWQGRHNHEAGRVQTRELDEPLPLRMNHRDNYDAYEGGDW